ncbi:hypothetical protein ACWGH4_34630 [Streptomyces sp. NPDC054847]
MAALAAQQSAELSPRPLGMAGSAALPNPLEQPLGLVLLVPPRHEVRQHERVPAVARFEQALRLLLRLTRTAQMHQGLDPVVGLPDGPGAHLGRCVERQDSQDLFPLAGTPVELEGRGRVAFAGPSVSQRPGLLHQTVDSAQLDQIAAQTIVLRHQPDRFTEILLLHQQIETMTITAVPVPHRAFCVPAGDPQELNQFAGRHVVGDGRLTQERLPFRKASLGPQQGDQRVPGHRSGPCPTTGGGDEEFLLAGRMSHRGSGDRRRHQRFLIVVHGFLHRRRGGAR